MIAVSCSSYSILYIDIVDHPEHHTPHTHITYRTHITLTPIWNTHHTSLTTCTYNTFHLIHTSHHPLTHIPPHSSHITLHTYHTTPLTLHTTPPTHRLGLERDLGENFNPMSTSDADIAKFQECVAKFQRRQQLLECQGGTLCPNTIDKIRHVLRMKRHTIG